MVMSGSYTPVRLAQTSGIRLETPPPHPPFDRFFEWLAGNLGVAIGVFILAVAISVIYLYIIRRQETADRESWRWLLAAFVGGFSISVLIAFVLNYYIMVHLLYDIIVSNSSGGIWPNPGQLLAATVMAPLTEEPAKILSLFIVEMIALRMGHKIIKYERSGIVFGMACGLGFAASENVLYMFSVYYSIGGGTGVLASTQVLILRSAVSTLGHAIFSGFVGYGYAKYRLNGDRRSFVLYLLLGIGLHSFFNLNASFIFGIFVIMFLVPYLFVYLLNKITEEEQALGIYREPVEYSPAYYLPEELRRRPEEPGYSRREGMVCTMCGKWNRGPNCVFCGYRPPRYSDSDEWHFLDEGPRYRVEDHYHYYPPPPPRRRDYRRPPPRRRREYPPAREEEGRARRPPPGEGPRRPERRVRRDP